MTEEMGREEGDEQEQAAAAPRGITQSLQEWAVSQADAGALPFSYP